MNLLLHKTMNRSINVDISVASVYSEDIDTSKLASHLKLLSHLFELQDNETIDMSTIIKNCKICHEIDAY